MTEYTSPGTPGALGGGGTDARNMPSQSGKQPNANGVMGSGSPSGAKATGCMGTGKGGPGSCKGAMGKY